MATEEFPIHPIRCESKKAWTYKQIESDNGAYFHFRITHASTDSRVGTCYDERNAILICEALNSYDPEGRQYP